MRLLLNAEPFGFGPSAAIAAFFPHLRPHCSKLGYVGAGHTLDLQRALSYDAFHQPDAVPWHEYDAFLTALDFDMAAQARAEGLKVAIYDPLTWYFGKVKPVTKECLYLAQDFYGVKERLQAEAANLGRAIVVPPIVELQEKSASSNGVLVNLGGLQNPLWSVDKVKAYALAMAKAIRSIVLESEAITLTTSAAVREYLAGQVTGVQLASLSLGETQQAMSSSKIGFMTPGLGNLYDASAHGLATVWLPPANDSQGEQLDLLREHGHADGWVDWSDLGFPVRYTDEQPVVMEQLAAFIDRLNEPDIQQALHTNLQSTFRKASTASEPRIRGLVGTFGHGGAVQVAKAVLEYAA